MNENLKIMSNEAVVELRGISQQNIEGYIDCCFKNYWEKSTWSISSDISYDRNKLSTLRFVRNEKDINQDLENSKIVGQALKAITPALANEKGIWIRLCHSECWEYSKQRWLHGKNIENLRNVVRIHMFGEENFGIRDDLSVARLWWNWYISQTVWPENPERALELVLTTADIRMNFVERFWMSSRVKIGSAVLRAMDRESWILDKRERFRSFMKNLNRYGGGIVFEAYSDGECDEFVEKCLVIVKKEE